MCAMPVWLQYLIAVVAFVALAPLIVWLARRFGGRARGGRGCVRPSTRAPKRRGSDRMFFI